MGDAAGEELLKSDKEDLEHSPYATLEELKSGKLPPEEILSLPMFKVPYLQLSDYMTYYELSWHTCF